MQKLCTLPQNLTLRKAVAFHDHLNSTDNRLLSGVCVLSPQDSKKIFLAGMIAFP